MNILIFKTNIRFKKDVQQVASVLNRLPSITAWNVDREDIDKVLRIEAQGDHTTTIIKQIQHAGYCCEVLF